MKAMQVKTLGDHIELLSGFAFASEHFASSSEGIPLVRIRDVVRGYSETGYTGGYDPAYLVDDGDILIGMDGEFNAASWKGGKALLNQRVCRLRPRPSLDERYMLHFLPLALKKIEDETPFVTVKHLSSKTINKIRIALPEIEEQRRIAAILDQAEALRTKRRQALAKLDTLTQSLFLEMFGDLEGDIEWRSVNEICELVVDCVNRTAPLAELTTPYKMIRTSNVKFGKVDLSAVRYVTKEVFDRWNRRAMPKRFDVLLTREAPVGEVGMLDSDDCVFLGQRLMLYRANPEIIVPEYLLAVMKSRKIQKQLLSGSSGSTVKHLSLPLCRSFMVPLPPLKTQARFSTYCLLHRQLERRAVEALRILDALFASLQHRAFNGDL